MVEVCLESCEALTNLVSFNTAEDLDYLDGELQTINVLSTSIYTHIGHIQQLANLVLHMTVERIYIGSEYGEIDRGVFLIRGENVVLCGEIVSFPSKNYPLITHYTLSITF